MKRFLAVMILGLLAAPAAAQPWYARGSWDDWLDPPAPASQMIDQGGGHYTANVAGLFANTTFEYKLAEADYDPAMPGSNGKVTTDAAGEINFHLYDNTTWTDGWSPNNARRVGYNDSQQYDWEVVGSFNSWPAAGDPAYYLNDLTNGLHSKSFTFATPGIYQFKFRKQGDWDVNIGDDFGNSAGNNKFRIWDAGDSYTFSLDLPNGRWQAVPGQPTPDLNGDDYVDSSDYVLWRNSNGSGAQYTRWRAHFGDTPPPPDESAFYARGTFNGYNTSNPLTNQGGCCNLHDVTISGLTPGDISLPLPLPAPQPVGRYNFTVANADYTIQAPNGFNDIRALANAAGELKINFYNQTTWTDGWEPDDRRRAGYVDSGLHGWELMGEWVGFGSAGVLTDQGGGLYRVEATLAATTDGDGFGFKFRKWDAVNGGDWDVTVGLNFGNSTNAQTGVLAAGTYAFELDLPRGAWRITQIAPGAFAAVPEPTAMALMMIGAVMAMGFGRRR